MGVFAIDHVQLGFPAGEQAVIRHFYNEVLGLPEVAGPGSALRFQAGQQRIDLVPQADWPRAPRPAHLALQAQNLPGLRARLRADGFALDEGRTAQGHTRFYVNDPAGNALELLEAVPSHGGLL